MEENRLYLIYNEHRTDGKARDPENEWTSYEDSYVEVIFRALSRSAPKSFFCDSIEVDPKFMTASSAYLAVVRYSNGGTFGITNGLWYVVGLAETYLEAEKLLEEALKSEESYKPWVGYFAGLEGTEVHFLPIS